jgi:uncharacterized membrane protein YbhN (UPF0104 family)
VFLFLGFLWDAFCWWKVLKIHQIGISPSVAIMSHGMPIFAKYIPGKAWTILGRATYVTSGRVSLVDSTLISTKAQIVLIFAGLLVGVVPSMLIKGFSFWSAIALVITVIVFLFFFNKRIQFILLGILSRVLKKDVLAHALTMRQFGRITAYYSVYWLLLMIGYFFLVTSVFNNVPIVIAFALPVSTTIGILVLIAPGGLGVREGVMVGFLGLFSIPINDALTLSILARLWFLLGELFMFVVAVFIHMTGQVTNRLQSGYRYDK